VRRWIRNNPWVWLLLIVFLFLAANAIFLIIAMSVPPVDRVD
jgi:hypothetical protein